MKKLPREVYFFVVLWVLFAPILALYFALQIVYVNMAHIDPATVANLAFLWPVVAIAALSILLLLELTAYSKFKMGFFSAWIELFFISIGK
ncbi:hypothetical protein ATY78_17175 [Rhizobium sp. R635]|uniref:hypothetical protein n=1 Tax=Rhizobium sp. R635 TaxID=1764275 RepID=UPI000B52DF5B|nr:hypothetical protein [Rhizobium sp. R635]OWV90212.1 hypothetical protein ATY78_17175 [Rhizobium sp. R635]